MHDSQPFLLSGDVGQVSAAERNNGKLTNHNEYKEQEGGVVVVLGQKGDNGF